MARPSLTWPQNGSPRHRKSPEVGRVPDCKRWPGLNGKAHGSYAFYCVANVVYAAACQFEFTPSMRLSRKTWQKWWEHIVKPGLLQNRFRITGLELVDPKTNWTSNRGEWHGVPHSRFLPYIRAAEQSQHTAKAETIAWHKFLDHCKAALRKEADYLGRLTKIPVRAIFELASIKRSRKVSRT